MTKLPDPIKTPAALTPAASTKKPASTYDNTFARLNKDNLIEIVSERTGQVLQIQSSLTDSYDLQKDKFTEYKNKDGATYYIDKTLDHTKHLPSPTVPFSEELADIICQKIAEGETITQISKNYVDLDLPSFNTIARWRRSYPDFDKAINLAFQDRAHVYHDKLIDTADPKNDDGSSKHLSKDEIPAARLKMDAYKWAAEKGNQSAFGNQTKIVGDASAPLQLIIDTGVPLPDSETQTTQYPKDITPEHTNDDHTLLIADEDIKQIDTKETTDGINSETDLQDIGPAADPNSSEHSGEALPYRTDSYISADQS